MSQALLGGGGMDCGGVAILEGVFVHIGFV